MKKIIRKIFIVLGILLALLIIWQHELIWYALRQAKGQLTIVWKAEPIEDALKSNTYPDSLKRKLLLVQDIRKFAVDSLGLKESENYTTVYNQHGKALMFVVTACKPYKFDAYEWSFPLLGSFPYKGFFSEQAAEKEGQRLEKLGYDVEMGPTGGWSTLGWLKDPILSNMLYRSEGDLAELIIHELTHSTLYVKDSVDFNENLAQFIGVEGAKRFLRHKMDTASYNDYVQGIEDEKRYTQHIFNGYSALNRLYHSFGNISDKEKDTLKMRCIGQIISGIDTVQFYNKKRYHKRIHRSELNNAYFMEFRRYEEKQTLFADILQKQFNGNIKLYLVYLKDKYPSM